jgi:hypothetical protein
VPMPRGEYERHHRHVNRRDNQVAPDNSQRDRAERAAA